MKRLSLASRLTLLFALLSLVVLGTVGIGLYRGLQTQLVLRDDAALVTRVEQLRALLQDTNTMDLVREKPQLFETMLNNSESLLVLRMSGHAPMIEVNPGHIPIPNMRSVPADAPLTLSAVHHAMDDKGIPFIGIAAMVRTGDAEGSLQIIAGRAMSERNRLLDDYLRRIILSVAAGVALAAFAAFALVRLGLLPLRELARATDSIGITNLGARIDQSNAPSELAPLILAFNAMLDRLATGFTQMNQLTADMAHDLRTPISNLMGQTEVALGQRRSNDYYEALLASNFEEFQRLSRMMDNMLFLARSEHPEATIERVHLDIANEFERLADYFEGLTDDRNLRVAVDGQGTVWADPILLRRALANLIANAIQYADQGSTIILASRQTAAGTAISVENRGPEIPAEHREHLFDRFYRADAARRGSAQASGLGLSIVCSIMLLHQGQKQVTSENQITRFTLIFPIEKIN